MTTLYAVTENANTTDRVRFVGDWTESLGFKNRGYTDTQLEWYDVRVEELGFKPCPNAVLSPLAKRVLTA